MSDAQEQSAKEEGKAAQHAARQVWRAIKSWFPGQPTRIILVHRGEHSLWDHLAADIGDSRNSLRRVFLNDDEQAWDPLGHAGQSSTDELLIYHDPFRGVSNIGDLSTNLDVLRKIGREFAGVVFVSFPHDVRTPTLKTQLCDRYIDSLAYSYHAAARRADALRAVIDRTSAIRIVNREDRSISWCMDGPFVGRTDHNSQETGPAPILQLPLGEIWITLDSETREMKPGQIDLQTRNSEVINLSGGIITHSNLVQPETVSEIGIGVNPRAKALGSTVLSEKADCSLHLGIGENISIGGRTSGGNHSDLMLADSTELHLLLRFSGNESPSWICIGGDEHFAILTDSVTDERTLTGSFTATAAAQSRNSSRTIVTQFPAQYNRPAKDNSAALEMLGDPRLSELVTWKAPESTILGAFGAEAWGLGSEPALERFYDAALDVLGPLPWNRVDIVSRHVQSAHAEARPGVILVSPTLLKRPLEMRWLYVTHELVHQWLGGIIRLGPIHRDQWERNCEFASHALSVIALGKTCMQPFLRLQDRQSMDEISMISMWTGMNLNELHQELAPFRTMSEQSLDAPQRLEDVPPPLFRRLTPSPKPNLLS